VIGQYQYVLQTSLGGEAAWGLPIPGSSSQSLNAQALGAYTERPTITYSPLTGEKFSRSLMTPIPPASVLSFLQGGYPADLLLRVAVHSINGIRSRFAAGLRMREADPEFYQLTEKLRSIQESGEIGMRVEKVGKQVTTSVVFSKKTVSPAVQADRAEVRRLLGLNADTNEFSVVYGSVAANDKEIAMLTRSLSEILTDLSSYIEVSAANVEQKRTYPSPPPELANDVPVPPLLRVHSSRQKPDDAFAAVRYEGDWYWIDNQDFPSKKLFSFIMFLFSLVEPQEKPGAPIITIPTG
jgi:hypothetical protein